MEEESRLRAWATVNRNNRKQRMIYPAEFIESKGHITRLVFAVHCSKGRPRGGEQDGNSSRRWRRTRARSSTGAGSGKRTLRSEEHTSELQSLRHHVCRL